jgi:hypothetical protein
MFRLSPHEVTARNPLRGLSRREGGGRQGGRGRPGRGEGNPLDSVEVFSRVRLVIKGGMVVRDDRPRH